MLGIGALGVKPTIFEALIAISSAALHIVTHVASAQPSLPLPLATSMVSLSRLARGFIAAHVLRQTNAMGGANFH